MQKLGMDKRHNWLPGCILVCIKFVWAAESVRRDRGTWGSVTPGQNDIRSWLEKTECEGGDRNDYFRAELHEIGWRQGNRACNLMAPNIQARPRRQHCAPLQSDWSECCIGKQG